MRRSYPETLCWRTGRKAIINIVDATNIERNLYLTMQLLEMDVPMVIALNMMDEITGNGGTIDVNGIEAMLGVPVVPISAAKNQGVDEAGKACNSHCQISGTSGASGFL